MPWKVKIRFPILTEYIGLNQIVILGSRAEVRRRDENPNEDTSPICLPARLHTSVAWSSPRRLSYKDGTLLPSKFQLDSEFSYRVVVAGHWTMGMKSAECNYLFGCIPSGSFLFQIPHFLSSHISTLIASVVSGNCSPSASRWVVVSDTSLLLVQGYCIVCWYP